MNRVTFAFLATWLAAFQSPAPRTDVFVESIRHPAIDYLGAAPHDAAAALNERLAAGAARLAFDRDTGYLLAVLDALRVPVESQTLVFSQGSAQAKQIGVRNPRALYFNDAVAVGWVRGADRLELAVHDPRQGVEFYTIEQKASDAPRLTRETACLRCHLTWDTLGVPGLQVLSTFPMSDDPNAYADGLVADHRTPIDQRWGGWFVTGKSVPARHMGNQPVIVPAAALKKAPVPPRRLASVAEEFDTTGYPARSSDIVSLMVLTHQAHMTNLITRAGWEARVGGPGAPARVREAARDLVDYLLFIDEAPLAGRVEGSSGFAEWFEAQGARDGQGRSLRQFDLQRRLFRYPCSYMIYTAAFDALPSTAKDAVYGRLADVLAGREKDARYARLSLADRQAIAAILGETKKDFLPYFQR